MLSPHFSLSELTRTQIKNYSYTNSLVSPDIEANLRRLCLELLEPIRDAYGFPVYVNSGYRCRQVNRAVGGSPRSYHLFGRAADVRGNDLFRFRNVVRDLVDSHVIRPLEYIEYSTFIHLAL
ncbi:peptidase [Dipodfec virus UOA04_Rod_611]|nr:peptidase [Dipodfec virus UOA04_Rod_611]